MSIIGQTINVYPPELEYSEIILQAEITHYIPSRPAPPCNNPDSPAFSDPGEPGECEYTLTGYFRCPPCDMVNNYNGDCEESGLMIPLTDEQLDMIDEHYEIALMVQDKADLLFTEIMDDELLRIEIDKRGLSYG